MYAIDFSDNNATDDDTYLWWVSDETFKRAMDEAVALGYLHEAIAASVKEQASWYRGLGTPKGTRDILRPLFNVAVKRLSAQTEADEEYAAERAAFDNEYASENAIYDEQYARELADLVELYKRHPSSTAT